MNRMAIGSNAVPLGNTVLGEYMAGRQVPHRPGWAQMTAVAATGLSTCCPVRKIFGEHALLAGRK